MKFSIKDYETIIFDCDGVILNSNNIKIQAFYETALIYGHDLANELVKYHIENGGISRYQKFEFSPNVITHTSPTLWVSNFSDINSGNVR